MRWGSGRSSNIEDRRGMGMGKLAGGGIGTIVIALIAMYFGVDPSVILNQAETLAPTQQTQTQFTPEEERLKEFMSVVLADTEDVWGGLFSSAGKTYEQPKLVLFSGAVQSGCGAAQSAMGPFYCPADRKLYLDMSFFNELSKRLDAPGDFAQAYVVAHEVGHHVQNVMGIADQVRGAQQNARGEQANALQVRMELQADCFAGVWAYHANKKRQILEPGDAEEALAAASGVGDDRLQKKARGYVVPESFTHGSSEQRMRWFKTGMQSGEPAQCDTFNARNI